MIVLAINYLLISHLMFTIKKTTVWLHLLVFRLEFKVKFEDSTDLVLQGGNDHKTEAPRLIYRVTRNDWS